MAQDVRRERRSLRRREGPRIESNTPCRERQGVWETPGQNRPKRGSVRRHRQHRDAESESGRYLGALFAFDALWKERKTLEAFGRKNMDFSINSYVIQFFLNHRTKKFGLFGAYDAFSFVFVCCLLSFSFALSVLLSFCVLGHVWCGMVLAAKDRTGATCKGLKAKVDMGWRPTRLNNALTTLRGW